VTARSDPERAAAYVIERARLLMGSRANQGRRKQPLCDLDTPALAHLAEHRVCKVPERAVGALFAWARGQRVELRSDVPPPSHLLSLQARGERCVSLLPESETHSAANGFEFVIHDLCHLGKLLDPEHHLEQVGYFASLERLFQNPDWRAVEGRLDATWLEDRDRLGADMNGSSVYLFVVLKMKLKMAARRLLARAESRAAPREGPLDAGELALFFELEEALYDALGLDGALRIAARHVSARRDAEEQAVALRDHFELVGRNALRSSA
jgi:hypothetical protein